MRKRKPDEELTESSRAQRERRERRQAMGLCSFCREPVVPGRTLCARHLEILRDRTSKTRKDRMAVGLCNMCGKRPATENYHNCEKCREYYNAHRKATQARTVPNMVNAIAKMSNEDIAQILYEVTVLLLARTKGSS